VHGLKRERGLIKKKKAARGRAPVYFNAVRKRRGRWDSWEKQSAGDASAGEVKIDSPGRRTKRKTKRTDRSGNQKEETKLPGHQGGGLLVIKGTWGKAGGKRKLRKPLGS